MVFTTVGVAVVAHAFIDDLSWASAFVLGAIVSPTDPLAATSIARRLGVPRKLVTIVEGESLVNDGTGLVLYRVAVAAVVTGSFSAFHTGGLFIVSAGGGIAFGLGVGWLVRQIRRRLDNPPAEITISLLTGYLAFIPADLIGVSAVLATVTAGVYLGWHTPELTTAQVRLQGVAVWEIVQYLLNALLFVLVGLQLPVVVDALGDVPTSELLLDALLVCATVILLRFGWVFLVMHAPKWVARRMSNWRGAVFLSWAGMRGAVSLAAALALPLETDAGSPFPGRELIIFLTFCVILATLVGQGLTLPVVIRWMGLEDDGDDDREDAKARIKAAEAALARLEELLEEDWVREDTAERVRGGYRFRTGRFQARLNGDDDDGIESRSQDYQRLRHELLEAERGGARRAPSRGGDQQRGLAARRPRPRSRGGAARQLTDALPGEVALHLRCRRLRVALPETEVVSMRVAAGDEPAHRRHGHRLVRLTAERFHPGLRRPNVVDVEVRARTAATRLHAADGDARTVVDACHVVLGSRGIRVELPAEEPAVERLRLRGVLGGYLDVHHLPGHACPSRRWSPMDIPPAVPFEPRCADRTLGTGRRPRRGVSVLSRDR